MRITILPALLFGLTVTACSAPGTLSDKSTLPTQAKRDAGSQSQSNQGTQTIRPIQPGSGDNNFDLMYYMLVAELAARRGALDMAYQNYLDASALSDDPQLPERAARIAVFAKAWNKAVVAGKKWLALDPTNIGVRHILASSYMRLKNKAAAVEQFVAIIESHPGGIDQGASVSYALLRHEANQPLTHAIAQTLANRFTDSAVAYFTLARLSAAMGDKTTTIDALNNTLILQPDHPEAILLQAQTQVEMGEGEQAFTHLRQALQRLPDDIALNSGYARLLVQSGHHNQAIEAMEKTFKLQPNNATVVLNLGLMALQARRLNEAKAYLNRVVSLKQRVSEANYYLGRIADSQREYQVAIKHYAKVADNNLQLDAQTRIVELLALLGHVDQARFRLQRLRELNTEEAQQIHFILVENKILRETGQHQEALDVLTAAMARYPQNVDILYARALAAEKMGHEDVFEQHLRSVLQIEPKNARALNALGYYLVDRSRELDEAERYIKQAIEIMPTDPAIIDSLGWLSYRRGNYTEALQLLRKAYQLLFDPEIAAHLGEVLWVSGDRQSASEIWDDALKQRPGDALLKRVIKRFRP